jgi:hypothetical protein
VYPVGIVECDDIEATIARYRRLARYINEPQMREAADRLIAGLEAEKQARRLRKYSGHSPPSEDLKPKN